MSKSLIMRALVREIILSAYRLPDIELFGRSILVGKGICNFTVAFTVLPYFPWKRLVLLNLCSPRVRAR